MNLCSENIRVSVFPAQYPEMMDAIGFNCCSYNRRKAIAQRLGELYLGT